MTDLKQAALLIIEDDLDIAEMLSAYFRLQGYQVTAANWGEDGVQLAQTNPPDLVILDIRLPDIDGYEVARRLRASRRTQDLPIIFLTEKRERMDRLKGLALQVEDYITKPFDIQELRLRVRNTLARARRSSLTNPVTQLPEGSIVEERLEQGMKTPPWAVLIVRFANLDQFRERYGFVAADDLLRAVALMLKGILTPNSDDFLASYSPSEFLIATTPALLTGLKERILALAPSFDYFYSDIDRGAGDFESRRIKLQFGEIIADASIQTLSELKSRLEKTARKAAR